MNLANSLQQKLDSWSHSGDGVQSLAFLDESGVGVRLDFLHLERLSCEAYELAVTRSAESMAKGLHLEGWARRIADEATGLLEPLKLIEVDALRGEALLRSDSPAQRADERFYYEVLLEGRGSAILRRYRSATESRKREQVSFVVTREALGKLVEDLAR